MVLRLTAPVALALMLAGCISIGGGGEAPEQLITFRATDAPAPGSGVTTDMTNAIVVFAPEVDDRLDVNRVPVQVDETGVAYLKDATYVDRPARLFQHLLAETLRAKSGRLVIEGEDPGVQVRTRVYGRLIEAGYDAQTSSVSVVYDAIAITPDGSVRQERFGSTVDGVPAEAASVAPALNRAANAVALQAAEWVTAGS
ncbi:ABC-type transport auxiliary lipoprotein family protein [Croceicoccus naphthovorans]|nr:ABC transporter [Croceicoccus naphthovorans]